jgi:D-alanyl-D-alanine carboxypeptidase
VNETRQQLWTGPPPRKRRTPHVSAASTRALVVLLAALCVGDWGCSKAQSAAGPTDLSATLESFRASAGMPALAAAVFRGGTLVAQGTAGVRKLGDTTRVTNADEWHLGSDTKAMTATLIGLYVDKGTLHFSDTLGSLFKGETIDPGFADVTLDQLLQHRGGMPHDMPSNIWRQMWSDGAEPGARMKAVRALLALPPAQSPGTYAYSNAGYMVAGAALERAAKDSWEHLTTTQLWGPLGMRTCGFGAPGTAGRVDEPWGHATNPDGTLTPVEPGPTSDNPPSMGPAGTAHCSLADWGKFLALHLAGARGEPASLVSTATLKHLQTPPSGGDYASGWGVSSPTWAAGTALTHAGSNKMWLVTAVLAPAKNLAFVVATNCASDEATRGLHAAFGPLIRTYAP